MANQGEKVSIKKKVTLRQKQSEATPAPIKTNPQPKPKKWLWLIPVAVVVAGGAVVLANMGNKDDSAQIAKVDAHQVQTEDVTPTAAQKETVSDGVSTENTLSDQDNSSTGDATGRDVKSSQDNAATNESNSKTNANAAATTPNSVTPTNGTSKTTGSKSNIASDSAPLGASLSSSIEENALRVVRGEFGNGQDRKNALGDRYTEIQSRVNEMYREGRFN